MEEAKSQSLEEDFGAKSQILEEDFEGQATHTGK
jgi:hypothetical protein